MILAHEGETLMRSQLGFRAALVALATIGAYAAPAWAYLGSFNAADGYYVQSGSIAGDVSHYNAGQSGANAGGGGLVALAPDTGLWDVTGQVGGYFATAANRATGTSGAPPYVASPPGAVGAYIVGGHGGGRTGDLCLALRNDTPLGVTGPMTYDYDLDTFDFGGVSPASVTSGIVPVNFYYCPNPGDSNGAGSLATDKFTMSFKDSANNIGFQWGYLRDNSVVWRTNPSGPWTPTSFIADQSNWDGLQIKIDLTTDTFSIDYFDISASTTTNMVPAGTALNVPMTNLTTLGWQLEDGLFAGVGGKNFFDDFSFTNPVPEPSTMALVALAVGGLWWRKR